MGICCMWDVDDAIEVHCEDNSEDAYLLLEAKKNNFSDQKNVSDLWQM